MTTQVEQIERRLAELRRELAAPDGRRLAQRTASMTLVAVLPEDSQLTRVCEAIATLASRHPTRAIVLTPESNPHGPTLQVEVSATCARIAEREDLSNAGPLVNGALVAFGGPSVSLEAVCHEEVILHWRNATASRLMSLVRPLILADLPVYVWWCDDLPTDDELFRMFVEDADRLLVDTGSMREPWNALLLLDAMMADKSVRCVPADLAWSHLAPWRSALVRLADHPEVAGFLGALPDAALQLEYAAPDGGDAVPAGQALMMTAWLGSRLGWSSRAGWHVGDRTAGRHSLTMGVQSKDGPLSAVARSIVRPVDQAGFLDSLMLESPAGSLTAVREGGQVRATHRDKRNATQAVTAPLVPSSLEGALLDSFDRPVEDQEYQEALSFIASVIRSEEGNAWAATW